jgi:hypothetical protein
MKNKSKTKLYITLSITIPLLFFILNDLYLKNKTKKNGIDIIVKFDSVQKLPKRSYYYFSYYIETKKISTCNSGLKELFEFNAISVTPNKFYKAKRSKNDSKMIIVDQNEQVTDTVAILEAGFSIEDIK